MKKSVNRKQLRLIQRQASEITRINKTTISEIESDSFTGSSDIFERLIDAVGLQLEVKEKTYLAQLG